MSRPTAHTIQLTPVELLGCWTVLRLGELPTQLWIPPPGATIQDRDRLLVDAVNGLAGRGLTDGHRQRPGPHPILASMLRVIADSEFVVDFRLSDARGGLSIFGLGAVTGAHGITLITHDAGNGLVAPIELTPMDSTRVTTTLLGLAATRGPLRAGVGLPINIPADSLDTATQRAPQGDLWALSDRLRELGVTSKEATSLARMSTDIQTVGQLGATGRVGQFHQEHRGNWTIGFHNTPNGWFGQVRRAGTVSMYPTDTPRLLRQWHELINNVRRAR
jgi:EspG family